ncbi:hypothetical protein Tco_0543143 [Tanacetum coccineum]
MVKESCSAIRFPKKGIEVDKAKIDVIAKLPHPTTVKDVRSFLGHADQVIRRCDAQAKKLLRHPRSLPQWKPIGGNQGTAGDHRKVQLNELNELCDHAFENSLIYKEKTKRIHDSKIKNRVFNVSDQVLLFNSRLKMFSGKLKSHWSGPFTISHVFPYGIVELSQNSRPNFKVNGQRIKHYFGRDVPKLVVPDLQTFPKDK